MDVGSLGGSGSAGGLRRQLSSNTVLGVLTEQWRVQVADALLSDAFAPPPLVVSLARTDPAFNATLGDSGPLWLRYQRV